MIPLIGLKDGWSLSLMMFLLHILGMQVILRNYYCCAFLLRLSHIIMLNLIHTPNKKRKRKEKWYGSRRWEYDAIIYQKTRREHGVFYYKLKLTFFNCLTFWDFFSKKKKKTFWDVGTIDNFLWYHSKMF